MHIFFFLVFSWMFENKENFVEFNKKIEIQDHEKPDIAINETQDISKIDISVILQPGVYEILDLSNNFSYYGESASLIQRLEMHVRSLKNGTHHCQKLQISYNNQNRNIASLKFFILEFGPEWSNLEKRLKRQDEFIELNKHRCYNVTLEQKKNPKASCIRKISYKGKQYSSVRGALKDKQHVQVSRGTLIRQLKDSRVHDVFYLENENEGIIHGSIGIFAQKENSPSVFFSSMRACIRAGFAVSNREVNQKIQNNIAGWRYAMVDQSGNPIKGNYDLKDGEISFEMYLQESVEKNENTNLLF